MIAKQHVPGTPAPNLLADAVQRELCRQAREVGRLAKRNGQYWTSELPPTTASGRGWLRDGRLYRVVVYPDGRVLLQQARGDGPWEPLADLRERPPARPNQPPGTARWPRQLLAKLTEIVDGLRVEIGRRV